MKIKRVIEIEESDFELSKADKIPSLGIECRRILVAVRDSKPYEEPRDNFDLGYVKGLEDGKDKLIKELWNCRNELCLRCGKYEKAYLGACNDCRYNDKNMEQYKRGDDK